MITDEFNLICREINNCLLWQSRCTRLNPHDLSFETHDFFHDTHDCQTMIMNCMPKFTIDVIILVCSFKFMVVYDKQGMKPIIHIVTVIYPIGFAVYQLIITIYHSDSRLSCETNNRSKTITIYRLKSWFARLNQFAFAW